MAHQCALEEFKPSASITLNAVRGNSPGQPSAWLAEGWRKWGEGSAAPLCGGLPVLCAVGHRRVSFVPLLVTFLRGFCDFCKVSWNINYVVVGIIVWITHLKINPI